MNERIQELEKQAQRYVLQIPASLDINEFTAVFNEKFAQLIIQDCVEVCAGVAAVRAGYNDVDGRDTAYSCGDMIREHFGVRE